MSSHVTIGTPGTHSGQSAPEAANTRQTRSVSRQPRIRSSPSWFAGARRRSGLASARNRFRPLRFSCRCLIILEFDRMGKPCYILNCKPDQPLQFIFDVAALQHRKGNVVFFQPHIRRLHIHFHCVVVRQLHVVRPALAQRLNQLRVCHPLLRLHVCIMR